MDSGAATVNAGRLTVAQTRAAELAGASICPNWPVHKLLRQGSRVTGGEQRQRRPRRTSQVPRRRVPV